jgi:hypothetical protein
VIKKRKDYKMADSFLQLSSWELSAVLLQGVNAIKLFFAVIEALTSNFSLVYHLWVGLAP